MPRVIQLVAFFLAVNGMLIFKASRYWSLRPEWSYGFVKSLVVVNK
jgi:hypothetical protein